MAHRVSRHPAEQTLAHLAAHDVKRVVSLLYAHKPGIARELNRFAATLQRAHPSVISLGTASPDDLDAPDVAREALGPLGLRGIKLHCHVQRVAIDDPRVIAILRECERAGAVAVVHCGREPRATRTAWTPTGFARIRAASACCSSSRG